MYSSYDQNWQNGNIELGAHLPSPLRPLPSPHSRCRDDDVAGSWSSAWSSAWSSSSSSSYSSWLSCWHMGCVICNDGAPSAINLLLFAKNSLPSSEWIQCLDFHIFLNFLLRKLGCLKVDSLHSAVGNDLNLHFLQFKIEEDNFMEGFLRDMLHPTHNLLLRKTVRKITQQKYAWYSFTSFSDPQLSDYVF